MTAPKRVLFLCTGNTARSQMAEALLNAKAGSRFLAESAGSAPAAQVNPFAVEALRRMDIDWRGHAPRGTDGLDAREWDIVVTVCDHAKESCPILPGHPAYMHWSLEDPAKATGTDEQRQRVFDATLKLIGQRIDLMLDSA